MVDVSSLKSLFDVYIFNLCLSTRFSSLSVKASNTSTRCKCEDSLQENSADVSTVMSDADEQGSTLTGRVRKDEPGFRTLWFVYTLTDVFWSLVSCKTTNNPWVAAVKNLGMLFFWQRKWVVISAFVLIFSM